MTDRRLLGAPSCTFCSCLRPFIAAELICQWYLFCYISAPPLHPSQASLTLSGSLTLVVKQLNSAQNSIWIPSRKCDISQKWLETQNAIFIPRRHQNKYAKIEPVRWPHPWICCHLLLCTTSWETAFISPEGHNYHLSHSLSFTVVCGLNPGIEESRLYISLFALRNACKDPIIYQIAPIKFLTCSRCGY